MILPSESVGWCTDFRLKAPTPMPEMENAPVPSLVAL